METTEVQTEGQTAMVVADPPLAQVADDAVDNAVEDTHDDVTEDMPLPIAGDLLVVARNPAEMAQAQMQLVKWAIGKVALERAKLTELEALLQRAKDMRQRIASYSAQVATAKSSVLYYEKIQAAIEAGYCIVPNFPIQLIMVRTDAESPDFHETELNWAALPAVRPMALPAGEGRYVDPATTVSSRKEERVVDGKTVTKKIRYTGNFRAPELPARFAKMAILSDLDKAQKRRLFDAIGMLPTVRRPTDPMLIGQIRQIRGESVLRTISFMIAWWIDTAML